MGGAMGMELSFLPFQMSASPACGIPYSSTVEALATEVLVG